MFWMLPKSSHITVQSTRKNLAETEPILTLEEALWRVMSKLAEVEYFRQRYKSVGCFVNNQCFEAGELKRTLTNQTRYLDLIWHSESNKARFLTTWEWVEIVPEETSVKVAAIDDILVIPGTIPRQRQTESHTDPHPRHPQVDDLTSDMKMNTGNAGTNSVTT